MGNKNIKKEVKKKKSTSKTTAAAPSLMSIVTQPEIIKKPKKSPSDK